MLLGDTQGWAGQFLSFDERFLERISAVWSACLDPLPPQPEEDQITINLVDHLGKDPVVRRLCHWVEYQHEPFGTAANGAKYSKGKIDIAVLFDWERERYLAYECKRLNVCYGKNRASLATPYVQEGMMRFMTEQYAENLPLGCMLGYVIDGDIQFAMTQVSTAIGAHDSLGLLKGPDSIDPISGIVRMSTRHQRASATMIELRHSFISLDA